VIAPVLLVSPFEQKTSLYNSAEKKINKNVVIFLPLMYSHNTSNYFLPARPSCSNLGEADVRRCNAGVLFFADILYFNQL